MTPSALSSSETPRGPTNQPDWNSPLSPQAADPELEKSTSTKTVSPIAAPQQAFETTIQSPSSVPRLVEIIEPVSQYQRHRPYLHSPMSSNSSQAQTRVESMWLASSIHGDEGKEVVEFRANASPLLRTPKEKSLEGEVDDPPVLVGGKKRVCGIRTKPFWFIIMPVLLGSLILLIIGLSVGLTVSRRGDEQMTTSVLQGPPEPDSSSKPSIGAMRGTGLAFALDALGSKTDGTATLYYQHNTGDIRYMQFSDTEGFHGGTPSETVASDAKEKTPISIVRFITDEEKVFHVFYVGRDGFVKQRTWRTANGNWQDGSINEQNVTVLDADSVVLQACYYPHFRRDGSSWPGLFVTDSLEWDALARQGMYLFLSRDESIIEQWAIVEQQEKWLLNRTWEGYNVHAGVACKTWAENSYFYVMIVDAVDSISLHWVNTNTRNVRPDWSIASDMRVGDVLPTTKLGYTSVLYAINPDSSIHLYDIDFADEKSSIKSEDIVEGANGPIVLLNGTQLAADTIRASSGREQLFVFAQTEGNDITLFRRDVEGGMWTSIKLPTDKD